MCYFRVFELTKFDKILRLKFNFLENGRQNCKQIRRLVMIYRLSLQFDLGVLWLFLLFAKLQNNRSHQIRFQSKIRFKYCEKKFLWTLFESFSKLCYSYIFLSLPYETIFDLQILLAKHIQTKLRRFRFPFSQALGV